MAANSFNTEIAPPPLSDQIATKDGFPTPAWSNWFLLDLIPRLASTAQALQPVELTGQSVSVAPTVLVPVASEGDYRVSWYLQQTTVDSTGTSVTFNALSTSFGQAITQSGAAMNGNLITTVQSGSFVVRSDAGGVISYSATVVLGTGDGRWALDIVQEFIG